MSPSMSARTTAGEPARAGEGSAASSATAAINGRSPNRRPGMVVGVYAPPRGAPTGYRETIRGWRQRATAAKLGEAHQQTEADTSGLPEVCITSTVASTVIAVGDEVLAGFQLDTNSHWLAERLRLLGFPVKRMTVVKDRQQDIVEQLRRDLA